tara:strand:- start:7132 stop:7626 length:495 start_codon:yes stop_codon:yes gene_type:complete
MEVIINDEKHVITFIEYQDGIPHSAITKFYVPNAVTGPYWRAVYWDFFAEGGDVTDVRFYESGSGGNADEIEAPQWVDGYTGKYWIHKDANFKGQVKKGKQLKNLKRFGSTWGKSINPFKHTEEVYSYDYCDRCGHHSTEYCTDHIYEDNEGILRYRDNDSRAE